jgi:uncharacterized phage protein (TIGR01671 family)
MSRIIITVPIQLVKADDGLWLQVETSTKQAASIHLDETGGPLTSSILKAWAEEKITEALLRRRRDTGTLDKNGQSVLEGDILRGFYNDSYGNVNAAVAYASDLGAFVLHGNVGGMDWRSENLKATPRWEVIGNVFQNSELLAPPAENKAA